MEVLGTVRVEVLGCLRVWSSCAWPRRQQLGRRWLERSAQESAVSVGPPRVRCDISLRSGCRGNGFLALVTAFPYTEYVRASYQTTERQRELLQMQHKFLCECRRCTTLPEDVRAFRCPNCDEGPCSPTTSAPDCRDLFCDACEGVMQLDDEAWKGLTDAEACETVSQETVSVLHPYHHKPTLMYMLNLLKLPPSSRASFLRQHADARERLYAHFCAPGLTSAMVANDIEAAAVAHLAGGELDEAAEAFTDAAGRFETFYGVGSQNALRCHKAAGAKTLDLFKIGGEVNAHR